MLRTRSPAVVRQGLLPPRAVCVQSSVRPQPGLRSQQVLLPPGRPAPILISCALTIPADTGRHHALPRAVTTEVWGDLPCRGSGVCWCGPWRHRPGSPSPPHRCCADPWMGSEPAQPSTAGGASAADSPSRRGTCYPSAPCSVKPGPEIPHVHRWPLEGATASYAWSAAPSQSLSGAVSVTTCPMACMRKLCWGPCTRGTLPP